MTELPPDMAWMNWRGWTWIAQFFAGGIGFYFGWDMRAAKARRDKYLDDLRRAFAKDPAP